MDKPRRILLIEVDDPGPWSPRDLAAAINEDPGDAPLGRNVVVHGALDMASLGAAFRKARRLSIDIEERRSVSDMEHTAAKLLSFLKSAVPISIQGRVDPTRHNHLTRDIKPEGQCPACDVTHENDRARAASV